MEDKKIDSDGYSGISGISGFGHTEKKIQMEIRREMKTKEQYAEERSIRKIHDIKRKNKRRISRLSRKANKK